MKGKLELEEDQVIAKFIIETQEGQFTKNSEAINQNLRIKEKTEIIQETDYYYSLR
ncbi:MAG: hypothetical protein FWH53_00745 [Leptospirales bacterium]|nr:hypothetical protein [Leptospirales bacterium]